MFEIKFNHVPFWVWVLLFVVALPIAALHYVPEARQLAGVWIKSVFNAPTSKEAPKAQQLSARPTRKSGVFNAEDTITDLKIDPQR
jgi:hypothetical protein